MNFSYMGGADRRSEIPMNLFEYFCTLMGDGSPSCEVFNRYRRIGILSVV